MLKKAAAITEVGNQQLSSELEMILAAIERIAAIERRLEKLDPSPRPAELEPYPIGSDVFGFTDVNYSVPLRVCGYLHERRRVLVTVPGEPIIRELPLESVRRHPDRTRAANSPLDPKAREFLEGRKAAQVAAKTSPTLPQLPRQRRYDGQVWELGD